jgi:hypothetical protein
MTKNMSSNYNNNNNYNERERKVIELYNQNKSTRYIAEVSRDIGFILERKIKYRCFHYLWERGLR